MYYVYSAHITRTSIDLRLALISDTITTAVRNAATITHPPTTAEDVTTSSGAAAAVGGMTAPPVSTHVGVLSRVNVQFTLYISHACMHLDCAFIYS